MVVRTAPLSTSLFVVGIVGFFISVTYVLKYSETWALTFALVFLVMFVASMISMAHAPSAKII